jgi:hypothetical protein
MPSSSPTPSRVRRRGRGLQINHHALLLSLPRTKQSDEQGEDALSTTTMPSSSPTPIRVRWRGRERKRAWRLC